MVQMGHALKFPYEWCQNESIWQAQLSTNSFSNVPFGYVRSWGPFLERPDNFSGPKAKFEIKKTSWQWIVAQFFSHKPVNFASLTDSFFVSFQNYWNFDFECKHGQLETAFRAPEKPPPAEYVFTFRMLILRRNLYQGLHEFIRHFNNYW